MHTADMPDRSGQPGGVAPPSILSTQARRWGPPPSRFSKGRYHERRQQRTLLHTLTTPDPETKSLPIPHSLAPTLLLPTSSADNCSTATALAIPPAHVSPDCDACSAASPPSSSQPPAQDRHTTGSESPPE